MFYYKNFTVKDLFSLKKSPVWTADFKSLRQVIGGPKMETESKWAQV